MAILSIVGAFIYQCPSIPYLLLLAHSGIQLNGLQAVFVKIVCVGLFNAQGCVGVFFPPTAKVKGIVDAPNFVVATDG
jgi:hypothetical protein